MTRLKSLILFSFLLISTSTGYAQVDPSSALLLRQSRSGEVKSDTAYGSGRFVLQPAGSSEKAPEVKPVEVKKAQPDTTKVQVESNPVPAQATAVPVVPAGRSSESKKAAATADNEVSEQYEEDLSVNLVQISISPALLNFSSSSDYWFYDYQTDGVGLLLAADVWLTTEIGVHADYLTSFAAALNAEVASGREIIAEHTSSTVALQFRSLYGSSKRSPSVIFGIGVSDQKMSVPKAETQRVGNKISSLNLHMKVRSPSKRGNAWNYGIEFLPNLKFEEVNTAVSARAGDDSDGQGVKIYFGKELYLDRKNQVYWRLSHRYDKLVFDGSVGLEDPRSEETPQDISINRGTTSFEFGYTWGD